MSKQTSLESMTVERNALRLQLENLEGQHRATIMQLRQNRPQIVNVNDTDDGSTIIESNWISN